MNKLLTRIQRFPSYIAKRTLLSQSYYCNDQWIQHRTSSPLLEKVNVENLYFEIDQRYQRSGAISAVDVDIYANKLQDPQHVDELLDIVHKLRLSPETSNTLPSTSHAVIRYLVDNDRKSELLTVLDDRLNYGLFLDYYTANMLMDKFYKESDFVAGCKIAAELMLQEEFFHPLSKALSMIHCYKYLLKPERWPQVEPPPEPEEEVKIRVRYLRNPFNDGHFDLRDGLQIVGKTLSEFTRASQNDPIDKSFHILGLTLQGKLEEAKTAMSGAKLHSAIVQLLPEDNPLKGDLENVEKLTEDIEKILLGRVEVAAKANSAQDIKQQCELFERWEVERKEALEKQVERLNLARRVDAIQETREKLATREEQLWFFDREEDIELSIERGKTYYPKRLFANGPKKQEDEEYIPPNL